MLRRFRSETEHFSLETKGGGKQGVSLKVRRPGPGRENNYDGGGGGGYAGEPDA